MTQPRGPAPQRLNRPPQNRAASPRDQVLARRRYALIALAVGVVLTLVMAIITGSVMILIVNIVVGVVLAGYIAMLLNIKQTQQRRPAPRPGKRDEDDMRVMPPGR